MTLEELAYGIATLDSGLYILYDKNGNFYYGSTVNLRYRLQKHYQDLTKGKHRNHRVQRSFNKYGLYAEIVDICPNETLLEKEQELIYSGKLYAPTKCMNIATDTYCSVRGIKRTTEASIKSAKTRTGQKRSDETKARMSIARKGKKQSEEVIRARILGQTGGKCAWLRSPSNILYGPIENVSKFSREMGLPNVSNLLRTNPRVKQYHGWRLEKYEFLNI